MLHCWWNLMAEKITSSITCSVVLEVIYLLFVKYALLEGGNQTFILVGPQ